MAARKFLTVAFLGVLMLGAAPCSADCLTRGRLVGVNLAGAEFNSGRIPGVPFKDYAYPARSDIEYVKSLGGTVIRLPFRWERLQPTLLGELSQTEVKSIKRVVETAAAMDICVILDVHNYATYRGNVIGSDEVPVEAFIDLWSRIYDAFPAPERTAFGLMNEPEKMPLGKWAPVAQRTVDSLREKGSKHLILVPGGRWSGAHDWFEKSGGVSNADVFADFQDKGNNYVIEVHQYADSNFSGTKTDCVDAKRLANFFGRLGDWARSHGHKMFLGEFGVAGNDACLEVLDAMLSSVADGTAWKGWTYWAAGQWWGNYPFSIQPKGGADAPQTKVLRRYMQDNAQRPAAAQ